MTEPQRLKDKYANQLEGLVLGSARVDVPSGRARARTLGALGLAGAAAGLPVTTAAAAGVKAAGAVGVVAALKWGAIGVAVGALALGGAQVAPRWIGPRPSPLVASTVGERTPTPSFDQATVDVAHAATDAPRATIDDQVADEKAERPSLTIPSSKRPPRTAAPPQLADEIAALDQARQALKASPARALLVLDDYERTFPRGELRPEALALRIDALVQNGQRAEAGSLAKQYLSRDPRGPHAKRIRSLVGLSEDAQ